MQHTPITERPLARQIEIVHPGKLIFSGPAKKRPALETLLQKNGYRLERVLERPDGTLPEPGHGLPAYTDPLTAEKAGAPNSGHTPGTLHPFELEFHIAAGDHKKAKICKERDCLHVGQTESRPNPLTEHVGKPYEPDPRISFVTCEWHRPEQIHNGRFIAEGCGFTLRAVTHPAKSILDDVADDPQIAALRNELDVIREMVGLPPRMSGAAVNTPAYAMQSGSHSAQLFRQATAVPWNSAGGVINSGDYAVTQNGTPNMSVNIAGGVPGGQILVPRTGFGYAGLYYGYNDAQVNLPGFTAPSANSWISTIFAQAEDAAYGDAATIFQVGFVTGASSASPVAPSLAASAMALANILIASTTTSITTGLITDKRLFAKPAIGPGSGLVGSVYGPNATSYNYASNTWTYPNTTNLAATFTVPASGNVWVDAYGGQIQNNGAALTLSGFNTVASGTPLVQMNIGTVGNSANQPNSGAPYEFHSGIYGLTPGATVTLYLGIYCAGTNGTLYLGTVTGGINGGPVSIKVSAL